MDLKSKILFFLLIILSLLSIISSAYRFFILKDYEIFWDDYTGIKDNKFDDKSNNLSKPLETFI